MDIQMRLDKFLSETGTCTRSEASKAAKSGGITVNGVPVKRADVHIDPEKDAVSLSGVPVRYKRFTYIMLNKPDGYISATEDSRGEHTVLELLDERARRLGLFPCGRLDKNTLGLLLLTNDGDLCHDLLSPKKHVSKVYRFRSERVITDEDKARLESGVTLDGEMTKPAKLTLDDGRRSGTIEITEGRFHQIKRMLEAVCNKIEYLERVEFAGMPLDTSLERGEWRELTPDEEKALLLLKK